MTISSFLSITAYNVEAAEVMVYQSIGLSASIARMLNTALPVSGGKVMNAFSES